MDTPPTGTEVPESAELPDSWKPTPKPGPRPSAPAASPQPHAAELLDKANKAEQALRRPGWDTTSPGYDPADHEYVRRKSKQAARRYTLMGVAGAVVIGLLDHTLPVLYELYEAHLDRQAKRALMKLEAKP